MLGKEKALHVKLEDDTELIITVPSHFNYKVDEEHNFTFDINALHYFDKDGNRI